MRYDVAMSVGEAKRRRKGRKAALLTGAILFILFGMTAWFTWDHVRFWWLFEPLSNSKQGYREYQHRETGIVFVRIPGGTFWMGSSEDDVNRFIDEFSKGKNRGLKKAIEYHAAAEHPRHKVFVSPFLMAKYEVSQAEWAKVMRTNPSRFKGQNLPVELVSWEDCEDFCKEVGLRLPTEAQWEFACRSGKPETYRSRTQLAKVAWYSENSNGTKQAVGSKKPNEFGIHDMFGNVLEWCDDNYDKQFYSTPDASVRDPICYSDSGDRVVRGGHWNATAVDCRSTFRSGFKSNNTVHFLGFRPAYYPLP